jgi:beta-N-acetylhexosaminidase
MSTPRRAFLPVVLVGAALAIAILLGAAFRSGGHTSHPSALDARAARVVVGGRASTTARRSHSSRATGASGDGLGHALGETIVSRMSGTEPSSGLLERVRAGRLGGVILFSENFAAGPAKVASAIDELQREARSAGTWPLLIMTDQEGGEVRRLADAPPKLAPAEMSSTGTAHSEGVAAGRALKSVGVNVDLAPVADVEQLSGSFLGERSFGGSPQLVAARACAFAQGLSDAGVDYTLKHFPGLGTASGSTDVGPVSVGTRASVLRANYAAYRRCARGSRALVMISNASYPTLTGADTPALDSPEVYRTELGRAGVKAVTISDDLQAGGVAGLEHPALRALSAGLDILLYAQSERAADEAYGKLEAEIQGGSLSAARVRHAAAEIARLKTGLIK